MANTLPTQEMVRTLVEAIYEVRAHPDVRLRSRTALWTALARLYAALDDRQKISGFDMEAADADSERLDYLAAHITNIDWSRYQNGDNIRAIIDEHRTASAGQGVSSEDKNDG